MWLRPVILLLGSKDGDGEFKGSLAISKFQASLGFRRPAWKAGVRGAMEANMEHDNDLKKGEVKRGHQGGRLLFREQEGCPASVGCGEELVT